MRRVVGVGVVLLLLMVLSPNSVFAQQTGKSRGFQLKGNYPNPFNPTTTISFVLDEGAFAGGRPAVVSIRIYSMLQTLVAAPQAVEHPAGNVLVDNLTYTKPGEYSAYWDGTDRTGRKVASGIYYYILVVNGEKTPARKMVVTK